MFFYTQHTELSIPDYHQCHFDGKRFAYIRTSREGRLLYDIYILELDGEEKVLVQGIRQPRNLLLLGTWLLYVSCEFSFVFVHVETRNQIITHTDTWWFEDLFYNPVYKWIVGGSTFRQYLYDVDLAMESGWIKLRKSHLPVFDKMRFSADGQRAVCWNDFGTYFVVADCLTGHELQRVYPESLTKSSSLMWSVIETGPDEYTFCNNYESKLHVVHTSYGEFEHETPRGVKILNRSDNALYIREQGMPNRICRVTWIRHRHAFLVACM